MDDERAGAPSTARVPAVVPAWAFWWFAVAFVLLVLTGRATATSDGGPALVWPAAGVGVLWLLARPGRRWAAAVLPTLAVLALAAHVVSGASPGIVLAGTLAAVVQPLVSVGLLRWWSHDLLGAGGDRTLSEPRLLGLLVAASVLATGAGAVVATASIAALGEPASWTVLELWWGRNLAGALLVAGSGHLLLHALVTGARVPPPLHRLPELLLVLAAGLASFVLIDLERGQPLAFLLIATSVWCALRFDTVVAALQVVVSGATAFALIVAGQGPFVRSPDPVDALTMQAFVITLLVITLAIGSSRDQRVAALAELDEARRDAAERARHLETVTEVMAEGLTVLDADGNLVSMNSAARAILDLTPAGSMEGASVADYVVTAPDGTVLDPAQHPSVRAITEGRVGPEDVVLVLADGTRRTLSILADQILEDGRPTGAVVVYRDVTDERRQADQLAEFAATAAHDLRSPLTALRGWIELAADTDDPVARQALVRARGAALRMQELVSDLLEQASAEGGLLSATEVEAVPLDLAVDDVVPYLDPAAVVTREEELPVVSARPEMLRQLLTNLLGNAVKYVEPGVTPHVAVTARRVGDRVAVEVRDNGIGIPEAERARVFERLHRAHAEDRRYAGTGLGLAICKTIVVRHGGHIECRPAPGGGTVFAFDLPAAVPDVPIVAPPVTDGAVPDEA